MTSGAPTGTELGGVAHAVLRVSDWRRSAIWYEEVLGFERVRAEGFSVFRHPGGTFAILLLPLDAQLTLASVATQRLEHLALHVPSYDALERWQSMLQERGVTASIDEAPGIGSSITLHDPDGLEIELFTPAHGSVLHAN